MRAFERRKKGNIIIAVALGVVMGAVGFGAAVSAADAFGNQYSILYYDTVTSVEEELTPVTYEEHTDEGPGEGIKIEDGETHQYFRSISSISWTVGSNVMKQTSGFSARKGQTISVSVMIDPNTKNVKVGIKDSSGNRRYVKGKGSVSHDFEIKKTDTYRVFVENTNTVSVEVAGNYTVN